MNKQSENIQVIGLGEVTRVKALEDALEALVDCFEPTDPPMLEGEDSNGNELWVYVNPQTLEALEAAQRVLYDDNDDKEFWDQE